MYSDEATFRSNSAVNRAICTLLPEEKNLYPFFSKRRAQMSVGFGILNVYKEREWRQLKLNK